MVAALNATTWDAPFSREITLKFATIAVDGNSVLIAKVDDDHAVALASAYAAAGLGNAPENLNALIAAGRPELARARTAVEKAGASGAGLLPLASVDWLPPQPQPSKVLGVAFNNMGIRKAAYRDPGVPNFFLKAPSCLTGHGKPIVIEEHYGDTIPELELAGVIGRRCRNITVEEARDAVFGYTIVNDVTSHGMKFGLDSIATVREPELFRPHHLDWRQSHGEDDRNIYFVYHTRSKATDTFGPMGPWITTSDEVEDPNALSVRGWLDGELFAEDNTGNYRFRIEEVIAEASRYFTLEAGDVICFGTSAKGAGRFKNGHRSVNMHALDGMLEIEIDGLGRLANPIDRTWVADGETLKKENPAG